MAEPTGARVLVVDDPKCDAAALLSLAGHLLLEDWVAPSAAEWAAIAALGVLPMGLAIYLWESGVKHGAQIHTGTA